MSGNATAWYVAGLIFVALLAMYAPKFAGAFVILLVSVLAIRAAQKRLV
jgi:hypothetical protein